MFCLGNHIHHQSVIKIINELSVSQLTDKLGNHFISSFNSSDLQKLSKGENGAQNVCSNARYCSTPSI